MGTPTLIIVHRDVPGMIAKVTNILSETNTNIGTMTVTRESKGENAIMIIKVCLLYTSDAADEEDSVDLGGRRIIKKKKKKKNKTEGLKDKKQKGTKIKRRRENKITRTQKHRDAP